MNPSIRNTIAGASVLGEFGVDASAIAAFFGDPVAREKFEAEIAANRAAVHAAIDRGMAPLNAEQERRWAQENGNAA